MKRNPAYIAPGVEGFSDFYGSYSVQLADGKQYTGNLCPRCRQVIQVTQKRVQWAAENKATCPRCGADLKPYLSSEFVFPQGVDFWEYIQWVGSGPVLCNRCGRVTNAGLIGRSDSHWEQGYYPDRAEYWRPFCETCWQQKKREEEVAKKEKERQRLLEEQREKRKTIVWAIIKIVAIVIVFAVLVYLCGSCLGG